MADTVWDLHKAIRAPEEEVKPRSDSDPGQKTPASDSMKAMDLAVPGGFRRHHVATPSGAQKKVSRALRNQISSKISNVYDPFIGSMLSQDNDEYDEYDIDERVRSLLQTPSLGLPQFRTPTAAERGMDERTQLLKQEDKARKRDSEKKTTLWHALLTLLKSFVGTGILFLPDGFHSGGLVFSPLCLTLVAALTLYAMIRLLQCRALVGGTYGHIGFLALGPWGRRMVQLSILLMQVGFCCTYVIFVAQNMADVLHYLGVGLPTSTLILLQIGIYIPLSWIRYISYFTYSNLIADVFILYGLAYIIGNSFHLLGTEGVQEVTYFNEVDYPVFIGTAVFTFEGVGLVLPTQSSLNRARQAKFPALLTWTVVGLLCFYCFFAGINYMALGQSIEPMVTTSLPRNGWAISVQFGYSMAQLLSYPLFLFPAVKIMEEIMGFPKRASGQKFAKNLFRAFLVLFTVMVAYFGQERLDLFVSIVGAFCCVPLSFVYPPLFYLKLQPNLTLTDKIIDSCVIIIGMLTFSFVTISNLHKWSN